uniref:HAT C-terminal dimerisation domain-containing protein n=1 Tax=Astyanax mexicanus TaxID=7994 RepID=A0A3B1IUN4_ASTMX
MYYSCYSAPLSRTIWSKLKSESRTTELDVPQLFLLFNHLWKRQVHSFSGPSLTEELGLATLRSPRLHRGRKGCPTVLVCGNMLAKVSLKLSKLLRHLQAKHSTLWSKPVEFFERKLQELRGQKLVLQKATANQKALKAAFVILHWIAKTGKPHTLGEPFLQCAKETVSIMCGKCTADRLALIPVSNDTVANRIGCMAKDSSVYFALQLDESTDVSGEAQLLVYEFLFCHFCVAGYLCTYITLTGTSVWEYSALAAKRMLADLKRATSGRLFKILCQEMGLEEHQLLYHSEVLWLSRGNVLSRLYELRDEEKVGLDDMEKGSPLAYLADVFRRLNELKAGLKLCAFPALEEFLNNSTVSKGEICVLIQAHLDGMMTQFQQEMNGYAIPSLFTERSLPDFWISLVTGVPALVQLAARLNVEDDLRLFLSPTKPRTEHLCASMQAHPSH